MNRVVDLRSDTVTQPSAAMRAAMAAAEVGDDVMGEDPSVTRLEQTAAALLGKEAAVFAPSGTMANLIAFLSQTRPGDTVLLCEESHPMNYEGGNFARFGGILARPLPGPLGKISPDQLARTLVQRDDPHLSPMTLAAIENTTNRGSGACYTPGEVAAIGAFCREKGLRLHCDGARLFNASTALDVPVAELAAPCDSVSFCLSKGLGAPMGSLLAGDSAMIHQARRIRKQLGGGLRQAGIVAAAGCFALEHHVKDLAADHRRARVFREALEAGGVRFLLPSPTNILVVEAPEAESSLEALAALGVKVFALGPAAIRVVFHRDITDEDLAYAIPQFLKVLA